MSGRDTGSGSASTEDNIAIVRRLVEQGTNGGDPTVFDALIGPDAVDHTGPPDQIPGPEAVKLGHAAFRAAFADAHATIEHVVAVDDLVVHRTTMRATHTGPFLGHAATGRTFAGGGMTMVRVVDGRLTDHWSYLDTYGMLRQLGLLAEPGG